MMYPPEMAPGPGHRFIAPPPPAFCAWRQPVALFLPLAVLVALAAPLIAGLGGGWQGAVLVLLPAVIGVAVGLCLVEGRRREGTLTSRGAVMVLFLGLGVVLSLLVPTLIGLGLATAIGVGGPDPIGGGLAAFALVMVFGVSLGLVIGVPLAMLAGLSVAFIALTRRPYTGGSVGP